MRSHDRAINSGDCQPTLESSGWHCREICSLRPPEQVQSLYLPTPEVKRFAGCQEVPVTRVAGLPVFHHFGGTGVREEIEIGAIEDTILILDEKRALLSEASTSGSAFSRCIAVSMAKFGYLSKCLAMLSRSRSMLPRWTLISA